MDFIQLFHKGGWLMWPILFLGILSISIFLERYVYLFYTSIPKKILFDFLSDLEKTKTTANEIFYKYFQLNKKLNRNEILILLQYYFSHPKNKRELIIKREGEVLIKNLYKRIMILPLITQIAPLIGLLGTVLGMIQSFQKISELSDQVAPSIIADGIWVAMLTTAFGLMVAIPSYLFYSIIESKVQKRIELLNYTLSKIDEVLKE